MKRNVILILVALALIALGIRVSGVGRPVGSPFSISGVRLGMSVKEVQAILGPDEVEKGCLKHESEEWMGDVEVQFDGKGRAIWISGGHLELNGLDLKPKMSPEGSEIRCPQFDSLLKEAAWEEGQRGDFTHEWHYPEYNLMVQLGCCGWAFFLRQE